MSVNKVNSLDKLVSPFREAIVWLQYRLEESGIYMVRWETYRSHERQDYLKKKGSTKAKAGQSPHNYGLAADFVLDTERVECAHRIWKSPSTGIERWVPCAWECDTPAAKDTWLKFGMAVRSMGLVWGGDFGEDGSNSSAIGWDYPHCELRGWRDIAKKVNGKNG